MNRLLSRMGLLGVFIVSAVMGQVFFASAVYAIEDPTFEWEKSYTSDGKLSESQQNWCMTNLNGESTADIVNYRTGSGATYVNACMNPGSGKGGICKTVEKGIDEEFNCIYTSTADNPLAEANKASEGIMVTPVQKLYCGVAANGAQADSLNRCNQAVRDTYFLPKCYSANKKDVTAGRSSSKDEANCIYEALLPSNSITSRSGSIINKNVTEAQVLVAVKEGRKKANQYMQAAIAGDIARLECINDGGTWDNGDCVAEENGSGEPVCSAGALGWIICPLTDFISDATQTIAEVIESQLIYPPLLNSPQGDAIRVIWGTVLGIANLGLVIVFLFIIFSQATSVGLSSYGVKKILPRLIAAAIFMNLSFFISAIAVDLANILGVSIKSIVQAGIESIDKAAPASDLRSADGTSWAAGVVGILGLGIAAFTGTIAFLVPVIITALIAVFTAFLVIAARGVIVTLLIIVAPLAFLAWILPNTEQWFTKWRKLFATMLLMFPLVMIVFYGSLLVSKLVLVTTAGGGDGDPKIMTNIIALGILTVPLFSLPFIMKAAGGVLDRFGVLVNNRSKGIVDRSRKSAQDMYGARKDTRRMGINEGGRTMNPWKANMRREANRDHKRGLRKGIANESTQEYIAKKALEGGEGRLSYAGRMVNSSNPAYIAAVQASARATVDKQDRESVANREVLYKNMLKPGDNKGITTELQKAAKMNDTVAVRALQNMYTYNGSSGIDEMREGMKMLDSDSAISESTRDAARKNLNENHGKTLKDKSYDMLLWSSQAGREKDGPEITLSNYSMDQKTWSGLSVAEIAGQSGGSVSLAAGSGAITPEKTKLLLKDARVRERLSEKQITALESVESNYKNQQQAETSYQQNVTATQKREQDEAFDSYNRPYDPNNP